MPNFDNTRDPDVRIKSVKSGNYNRFSKKGVKKFKQLINFDSNPPACFNCNFYSQDHVALRNSLYKHYKGKCKLFRFICQSTSVCDYWESKSGETLDNQLDNTQAD